MFLRGSGYADQQGHNARMEPGDVSLVTASRPYRVGGFEDYEGVRLIVPRAVFTRYVGEPGKLIARRVERSGLSTLLATYLQTYSGLVTRMPPGEADVAIEGALHLLRGLVDTQPADISPDALRALAQA